MFLRASTAPDANLYNSQKVAIDGLTYQPSTYYYLKIFNETTGASVVVNINGGGSTPNFYSTAYTFSVSPATTNRYRAEAKHQSSSPLTTVYVNFTSPPAPSPPTTPSISLVSSSGKTVTLRASISSNTTSVEWDDTRWNGGSYDVVNVSGVTSTDRTFTVPDYSTTYQWDVRAKNSVGNSSWSSIYSWTSPTAPAKPALVNVSISGLGGNSFFVNLSGGAGSATMNLEVRTGSQTSTNVVWSDYNFALTSQVTISGLNEYVDYYIKAYGRNTEGTGTAGFATVKTLDKTLPTVQILNQDGVGRIFLDFKGADAPPTTGAGASGLSAYIVYISSRNSTGLGAIRHATITNLDLSYFTFEVDYDGLNFVHNSTYTVGVRSQDESGNFSSLATKTLTYIKARPNNWNWITSKTAYAEVNVTAVEWESLGKAINQFRTYKSLVVRDFTVPKVGDTITATIFNQYINAINEMSPPTSPPSTKTANISIMLASDFNKLTQSLNSIT